MDFKFVTFLDGGINAGKITPNEAREALGFDPIDDDEPAIGDIVSLASGSPDMTVISLCDDCQSAECAWYDDYGMNIDVFPIAALILDDGE